MWPEEKIALMIKLINQTDPVLTARQIAAEMVREGWKGTTRHAVIGKAERMDIDLPAARERKLNPKVKSIKKPIAKPIPLKTMLKPFMAYGDKELHELEQNDCRFPLAYSTYCAKEIVPGYSYCESHCETCFQGNSWRKALAS